MRPAAAGGAAWPCLLLLALAPLVPADLTLLPRDKFHGMPSKFQPVVLDGVPASYVIGDKAVTVCLVEKCASSRFKALLCRASGFNLSDCVFPHRVSFPNVLRTKDEVRRFADSGRQFSLILVRNPYLRILSGYLDKYLDGKFKNERYLGGRMAKNFTDFVGMMYECWSTNGTYGNPQQTFMYPHFTPIVDHCNVRDGLRYDHYLKVEQMACWLKPFLRAVGIYESAATGWDKVQGGKLVATTECYYTPPNMTCEEYYGQDRAMQDPDCGCSLQAQAGTDGASRHATGSAAVLHEHFTPEAARQVTSMYAADFAYFEYPAWDGQSEFRPC